MLVDIVGKYGVFIYNMPQIETCLLKLCDKQLLKYEVEKLKHFLFNNMIKRQNEKIHIYSLISCVNEELQNRTNRESVEKQKKEVANNG
mgnify:CR=1 FL=1